MERVEFINRVNRWATEIGVNPKEIHLRHMKNKIASCSSKGRLTFDPSLLGGSIEYIDRVIVHELLHLKYPNHGKMFKSMFSYYRQNGLNKDDG